MSFACHCRSRTTPGRGGCTRTLQDIRECYKNAVCTKTLQDIWEHYKNATQLEFKAGNDEEYEMDGIRNSTVFAKESKAGHLPEICLPVAESPGSLHRQFDTTGTWAAPFPTSTSSLIDAALTHPSATHLSYGCSWRARMSSYQRYECDDDLSEGSAFINDTNIITTWVKGRQLSTISVRMTTWVKGRQLSTISVRRRPEWRVASYQRYEINTMTTWVKSC